jgi:hypothetical protein
MHLQLTSTIQQSHWKACILNAPPALQHDYSSHTMPYVRLNCNQSRRLAHCTPWVAAGSGTQHKKVIERAHSQSPKQDVHSTGSSVNVCRGDKQGFGNAGQRNPEQDRMSSFCTRNHVPMPRTTQSHGNITRQVTISCRLKQPASNADKRRMRMCPLS